MNFCRVSILVHKVFIHFTNLILIGAVIESSGYTHSIMRPDCDLTSIAVCRYHQEKDEMAELQTGISGKYRIVQNLIPFDQDLQKFFTL